jgi:hypothetical protein
MTTTQVLLALLSSCGHFHIAKRTSPFNSSCTIETVFGFTASRMLLSCSLTTSVFIAHERSGRTPLGLLFSCASYQHRYPGSRQSKASSVLRSVFCGLVDQ